MSGIPSNPMSRRISLVEIAGGAELPYLKIQFANIEAMHAASDYIRRIADETTCSKPSPSDDQESAFAFLLSVAADNRYSNEYVGNVARSWLHVLDGSSTPVNRRV